MRQKALSVARCLFTTGAFLLALNVSAPAMSFAASTCGDPNGTHYTPSIDLGCRSKGNPIMDMTFGIIRFLSDGVGLVVIASVIIGGIQYMTSAGNPQANAAAVGRIRSAITALLIYIFAYAILNYLLPAGLLKSG